MRLLTIYILLIILSTSCRHLDCIKRGEKIDIYILNAKVPYGDQLTLRNDSLVISANYYWQHSEKLQFYDSYIKEYPKKTFWSHFLINSLTGELIDTVKRYAPTYNTGKVVSAFFTTDTNIVQIGNIEVHKYILTKDYKGYQINFEWWNPLVRCPGEHRIAVYKNNINLKNYVLEYGINDFLIDGDILTILTAYSEWPDPKSGRHLQKISLDKIIQGLK